MKKPVYPKNEEARLKELLELNILDSDAEDDFNHLVELASNICNTPISLVTLLDADRQWFKAKKGVSLDSTPRDISFCGHAIVNDDVFIVENTVADERFYDNPLVTEDPNIRFYAGVPLTTKKGNNLGTLCVLDSEPKKLNEKQIESLKIISKQAVKLLELRESKNLLNHKNKKLESLNRLNNKITSIISHDLRGPISSLRSYLNSNIFDANNLKDIQEAFPLVKDNVEGIYNLTNNLLDWSRSSQEITFQKVNVADIIYEVFMLFESQAVEKNIKLDTEIKDSIYVWVDPDMFRFSLRNLVNNAIKFTENGKVSIVAEKFQNQAKISVIDTGTGIPPEILDLIQKKRKKVTTKGTRKEKGTGLGLQLINEFMEIHDTELKIESIPNKGSTFSFHLMLRN